MDADVDGSPTLIDDFDHLLIAISLRHTDQSAELADAVVDVDDVVAHLKLLYLLQRQCYLAAAGTVALEVVLVETVEYLMVGKHAELQVVINKTLVQRLLDGSEETYPHFLPRRV